MNKSYIYDINLLINIYIYNILIIINKKDIIIKNFTNLLFTILLLKSLQFLVYSTLENSKYIRIIANDSITIDPLIYW